ncbi:MAG TPA: ABC transporter permease [Clostridium sp.]
MSKKPEMHFLKKQKEENANKKSDNLTEDVKVDKKYKKVKSEDKVSKEHEIYLKKVKSTKRKIVIIRILILVIFIALWQIAASLKWIDPFLTSSPTRVIKSFVSLYEDGSLFKHIGITCYETILGFSLGTILGAVIAVILWSCPFVSKILDPYIVVLNALPKVALAPIIIFWIGNGMPAIIVIALLISVVTTVISILTGFNEIDKEKIMLMNTFRASKTQILRYLIFPYSIPIFISALKINVGLSWVGVIMGEFLVAKNGLGFLIVYGGQVAQLDMVMMSIVILSIIAFIMYEMVAFTEKKLVKDKN